MFSCFLASFTTNMSVYSTKNVLAPRVGFEPTTNWLHLSTNFLMGWTISSSIPWMQGASGHLAMDLLPFGIVSEPSLTSRAWLLITISYDLGFQQFTLFSMLITQQSCVRTTCSQPTALPLRYLGILNCPSSTVMLP